MNKGKYENIFQTYKRIFSMRDTQKLIVIVSYMMVPVFLFMYYKHEIFFLWFMLNFIGMILAYVYLVNREPIDR